MKKYQTLSILKDFFKAKYKIVDYTKNERGEMGITIKIDKKKNKEKK